MEGANNGGKLYHEIQESKLCALHCINTLLQGPYFSEVELAAHASDLDDKERQMMMLPAHSSAGGFFSHNMDLDGNFSIQVNFISSLILILTCYFIILIHNQLF
jgi:ataxin-3